MSDYDSQFQRYQDTKAKAKAQLSLEIENVIAGLEKVHAFAKKHGPEYKKAAISTGIRYEKPSRAGAEGKTVVRGFLGFHSVLSELGFAQVSKDPEIVIQTVPGTDRVDMQLRVYKHNKVLEYLDCIASLFNHDGYASSHYRLKTTMPLREFLEKANDLHEHIPGDVDRVYETLKELPRSVSRALNYYANTSEELLAKSVERNKEAVKNHATLDQLVQETPAPQPMTETMHGYHLKEILGEGGFGRVYLAESETGKKKVLKVPNSPDALATLKKEVAVQRQLSHKNIIDIEHIDAEAKPPYILMQYIEGAKSLDQRTYTHEQAQRVLSQVASALAYAHGKNVVHGDLKPQNVLVTESLDVKVSDFGLARILKQANPDSIVVSAAVSSKLVQGTPQYMSPEQRAGERATPAADAYAFGLLAFETIVGRRPEPGEVIEPVLRSKNVSEQLIALIQRSFAFEPAQRPTLQQYLAFFEPPAPVKEAPHVELPAVQAQTEPMQQRKIVLPQQEQVLEE